MKIAMLGTVGSTRAVIRELARGRALVLSALLLVSLLRPRLGWQGHLGPRVRERGKQFPI
jgi:hypothetical protein